MSVYGALQIWFHKFHSYAFAPSCGYLYELESGNTAMVLTSLYDTLGDFFFNFGFVLLFFCFILRPQYFWLFLRF